MCTQKNYEKQPRTGGSGTASTVASKVKPNNTRIYKKQRDLETTNNCNTPSSDTTQTP